MSRDDAPDATAAPPAPTAARPPAQLHALPFRKDALWRGEADAPLVVLLFIDYRNLLRSLSVFHWYFIGNSCRRDVRGLLHVPTDFHHQPCDRSVSHGDRGQPPSGVGSPDLGGAAGIPASVLTTGLDPLPKNLRGYYQALTVGESHNYYLGRAEADISGWLHYFCESMADAFDKVRVKAAECAREEHGEQAGERPGIHPADDALAGHRQLLLRALDPRQKHVLSLFRQSRFATTAEIARLLGVQPRAALNLCQQWMKEDFLIPHGEAKKSRKYELAEKWVELVE